MKKIYILILLTGILMLSLLVGCGNKVDSNVVKAYSDSIAESLLVSLGNGDYTTHTKYFDKSLQPLLTKDKVEESEKAIKNKIGVYVPKSAVFQKAVAQSKDGKKYTTVIYKAKFTDEPKDVLVTITYGDEDTHPVFTFLLNSPKLRQN